MTDKAIEIDWASASVEDARLTVELRPKPQQGWVEEFERVLERLRRGGHAWGEIEVGKRKLRVSEVVQGAEPELRHFLESAVLQANAATEAEDEASETSPADDAMAEAFRAFARESA